MDGINHAEFQLAVSALVRDMAPAAVICFCHTCTVAATSGCFSAGTLQHHHYDLLVVVRQGEGRKDSAMVDMASSRFAGNISVNVLCHTEDAVQQALREGNPFFNKPFREGALVYQADEVRFELAAAPESAKHYYTQQLASECERSLLLAQRFVKLAGEAIHSSMPDAGVFLLHQAMEQLCIASVKAHLCYRPATHNMARLIALVGCYLPTAKALFPYNTTDERELFDVLRKAYSEVRYKANYHVPAHVALSLLLRVGEFMKLVNTRYEQEFVKPVI